MPREHDSWLMLVLEREGYSENKLIRLNWVQCHQQVHFYLDIFDTRGRSIGRRYLTKQTSEESWSRLIFPREKPPALDFRLGKEAVGSIAPRGIPQYRLGNRINPGHNIGPEHKAYVEDHEVPPTTFWEVLLRWERTWMWDNIQWEGDDNWMATFLL